MQHNPLGDSHISQDLPRSPHISAVAEPHRVERLHVYDLEALCDAVDADVSAAWRVWREDMIGLDGRPLPLPAPERSSLPLPECYVETGGDGQKDGDGTCVEKADYAYEGENMCDWWK